MAADGSIIIDTRIDTKGIAKGTRSMESMLERTVSVAKKAAVAIAAAFSIRQIVAFSKECIALGSSLDEVQNVVDVTFEDAKEIINNFAREAATSFGLSELSAKQYASTIGAMFKSMGVTGDELTTMSIKITELAGDMASFYNLDTDEAFNKIRAGISGVTMPLQQLGINMSEANLEQFRMSQGLTKAYSQMTQQEKAILRYNYLLSVTSDAQGDFARTSNSWANQTRVLNLQLQSLKANLGKGLINVLTPALRYINMMLQGLAKLAEAFRVFTELITGKKSESPGGAAIPQIDETIEGLDDASDAANDYADATDAGAAATKKAAQAQKKYLSGLDEIKRYQTDAIDTDAAGSTGGSKSTKKNTGTSGGNGLSTVAPIDFGSLAKGETVLDSTAKKMKALYDAILKGLQPSISALKRLWNEGLSKFRDFTWTALRDFYNNFLVPVGSWTFGTGIPRFIDALNNGLMAVDWTRINGALNVLWAALAPFAVNVGEGLLWFWENVLVPLGTWTANEVVPRFLLTLSLLFGILNTIIEALKPYWNWIWENLFVPIAEWTANKFLEYWDAINEILTKFSDWCKDNPDAIAIITTAIAEFFAAWAFLKLAGDIQTFLSALSPVKLAILGIILLGIILYKNWDTIKEKCGQVVEWIKEKWEWAKANVEITWFRAKASLRKIWETIRLTVVEKFEAMRDKIKTAFETAKANAEIIWFRAKASLRKLWEGIRTTVVEKFEAIRDKIKTTFETVKTNAEIIWFRIKAKVVGVVRGMHDKIVDFAEKIKDGFAGAFNALVDLVRTPINTIIGFINSMIESIVNGVNHVIDALNWFSFDMPDWMGGQHFGLSIPRIDSIPQIPLIPLAQGAVIPPNAPFLAALGDQKHGTNVEAPLDTIKQALSEVLGGGGQDIHLTVNLDGKVVYDNVMRRARSQRQASGYNPFALEG